MRFNWSAELMISIHALRVEGDAFKIASFDCKSLFLSTPSGWRATLDYGIILYKEVFLSTPSGWRATLCPIDSSGGFANFYPRPPGGGRPYRAFRAVRNRLDFYPRPPGGGRHVRLTRCRWSSAAFLSTPSGWRATILSHHLSDALYISIHALRVEGDYTAMENDELQVIFLSTPSGWRATSATVTVTK